MQFIDLKTQYTRMQEEILSGIKIVLDNGKYVMGPEVFEIEKKLAEFVRTKYCISCSSGTDALLIALLTLGIKPGDEVITSAFSFFVKPTEPNHDVCGCLFCEFSHDQLILEYGELE